MTPITLIMAYYDNPGMLRHQYEHIRNLSAEIRDHLHVIIVDDGSPTSPAFSDDLATVPLQVYRMKQDIRWNQDACRNLGVIHSETEWLLLTDMDHLVPEKTWHSIISRKWEREKVYRFYRVSAPEMEPYHIHPNSWMMTRKMFEKIGGYDERFAGFYGTDADFSERTKITAGVISVIKEPIVRYPRSLIPDASTTRYLRKQPEDRAAIVRIKAERGKQPPLRGQFEYVRVYP